MHTLTRNLKDAILVVADGHDIIWLSFSLRTHAPGAGLIMFACMV